MKQKRKSPKALRQQSNRWGIITLGDPFVVTGALNFVQSSPAISFSFDYDTGIQKGDWISVAGFADETKVDHTKVHVARRRQSKGKTKPTYFEIENTSATTLTLKGGGTLTGTNGMYSVSAGDA